MPRRAWAVALLLLSGCPTTCPSTPLAPAPDTRWVVRFSPAAPAPEAPLPIPGIDDPVRDPPGVGTYSAIATYDATATLTSDRWLDTYTAWDGALGTFDAAAALPRSLEAGRLTVLLADRARPAVSFELATGALVGQTPAFSIAPEAGGQLGDHIALGDGTALATQLRDASGGAGGLVLLDDEGTQASYDLSALSSGAVIPGRLAAVGDDRAVLGLLLPDEPDAGAFALVNAGGGAIRVDLPGLRACGEVATLAADPAFPTEARVAVLCAGTLDRLPEQRDDAGLALVAIDPEGPPRIDAVIPFSVFASTPPSRDLVALDGAWIAAVSGGDPLEGRPDTLIAVDLASPDPTVLVTDAWTEGVGAALGSGAYAPDLGELWWPSSTAGIFRWQKSGATFTPLTAPSWPACVGAPPREVRHVPARTP